MDPNQKCKEANLTVKEVEEELNKIMSAKTDSEADKQQKFFNLLNRLKLPIDSADALCRRLSYPEMFKNIQEWIKNERADQRAKRITWAAYLAGLAAAISAACALVALLKS